MKQGWEIKRLGDIGTFQRGGGFLKSDFVEDGYPCVHYGQIHTKFGVKTYNHLTCISEELALSKSKIANSGDIIIAITSEDVEGSCKCTAWLGDYDVAVGGHAAIFKHSLNPAFVAYYFRGPYFNTAKKVYAHGSKVVEIRPADIATINISYPSLSEQEKIVAELDCLSGIIEKKKQQLKELDNLAQSIFYEMFGDPVENDKGWETAKLKDSVVEMFLGPFGSALKTECYVDKDASYCMVYEQKHAIRKTLNLETHYINQSKYNELQRFEVHSGDFIMSCRGTIGEIYRLPNDSPMGIIHPSVMKIRIKEDIYNPIFFNRLLSRIIKNETTSGNCVQMAITAKELGARKPILPPLKIQQDFASKIESIEKQKELIAKSIKETETLFNSRMDYYFNR